MPSCLVLGYLLLGVSVHRLVGLDVAGYAEQTAVGWRVCQSLHLLHALGCLHWRDVVYIHPWRVDALLKAFLAQSVGALEHLSSQQLPSLIIQQLLVSWVSAHGLVFVLELLDAVIDIPDSLLKVLYFLFLWWCAYVLLESCSPQILDGVAYGEAVVACYLYALHSAGVAGVVVRVVDGIVLRRCRWLWVGALCFHEAAFFFQSIEVFTWVAVEVIAHFP